MLKNTGKKTFIALVTLLLIAIPATTFAASSYSAQKTSKHNVVKQKTPAKKTKKNIHVLVQATNIQKFFFSHGFKNYIACVGPDGKTSYAPKADCDAVIAFWKNHRPSNPSSNTPSNSNTGSSNNGSSSNTQSSNPSVTVTPTPTEATNPISIISVVPALCTSSSCKGWLTTLIVTGKNFSSTSRVSLIAKGITYSEAAKDAQYTGGDGKTEIITDFYNLPSCTAYDVQVDDSQNPLGSTLVAGFSSACK